MTTIAFVSRERLEKRPQDVSDLIGSQEEFTDWIVFENHQQMSDLALAVGFFSSKTQARKNGWGGPIPTGYTAGKFGKNKIPYYIVNVYPHFDDDDYWKDLTVEPSPSLKPV